MDPEHAIDGLLQLQAEEIGAMVGQATGQWEMRTEMWKWREPRDHTGEWTSCESRHAVAVGWSSRYVSNTVYPEGGVSLASSSGKQDMPPAYKK